MNSLTSQDSDGSLSAEINCLRREINDPLDDEEIYWGQRAKAHWLREGDKNTSFFHAQASKRRKQNTILGIWDCCGRWCEGQDNIAQAAIDYFNNIYASSSPSGIDEVIDAIPTRVTKEMNENLNRSFTKEEVAIALKQIHPTKAPGPDGMSAIFYQKYWSIMGCSITNMVLNVLNKIFLWHVLTKGTLPSFPK